MATCNNNNKSENNNNKDNTNNKFPPCPKCNKLTSSQNNFSNNNNNSSIKRSPSFYRRPLPSHLVSFSSYSGRKVFREALENGFMEQYFPLAEQYHTQSEPACTCYIFDFKIVDLEL
eukprot:gb/GECH01002442.1/.p1 GENE.gb/GECH01002442.1/~~gb/GECH01002442.1/.p1  ORF type:complete len:117 (+),score=22.58 gb/GECH01002442.1/:1-351(+)